MLILLLKILLGLVGLMSVWFINNLKVFDIFVFLLKMYKYFGIIIDIIITWLFDR